MSQTELQYHRDLRDLEEDLQRVSFVLDGDIAAIHTEINNLRRFQTVCSTVDEVAEMKDRLNAIELVLEGLSEVIASEFAKKIKECLASLPEVISKEDFVQALDEFIFQ